MSTKNVTLGDVEFCNTKPFALIAGPCVMESEQHGLEMAHALKEITRGLGLGLIFKASFDKANRTSLKGERGMGMAAALEAFSKIKQTYGLAVTTDVHEPHQCAPLSEVIDILQIPAFLSRQTDLLVAAAQTKSVVNIKKGQFLAPWDIQHAVRKVQESGSQKVMVTERGASFGYNTLVVDMRSLPIMAQTTQVPVIFDATHSVQQPGGQGASSGGDRRFVPTLARAAVAVGVAGLFLETHENPDQAPSDGPNMVPLNELSDLLQELIAIDTLIKIRRKAESGE